MDRRLTGIALAFVSGVLFATLPILFRAVNAQGVNLITALALRFGIATLLIWLVVLPRGMGKVSTAYLSGHRHGAGAHLSARTADAGEADRIGAHIGRHIADAGRAASRQ